MAALKTMNDSLVGIGTEVRSGTDTISAASSQIAGGNLNLSARPSSRPARLNRRRRQCKR